MTPAEWIALAERCAAATGPDREIDWAIGFATGWRRDFNDGSPVVLDWDCNMFPEHFGAMWPSATKSLDTIVALIERELPAWRESYHWRGKLARGALVLPSPMRPMPVIGDAATPALALCASFCRAMSEKGNRQ